MESDENEASDVSSCETNSTESYDVRQRSEESTAARSVETQPTVSHPSRSSLEKEAVNRRSSLHLKSEEEEQVYGLSQKSSVSSGLNFSRHFAGKRTDFVEEDDVSYDDTFDSLDSLSENEDELSKTVEKTPSGNRSDSSSGRSNSIGSQSDFSSNRSNSSANRSNSSQLLSSHKEKTSIANRSKSSSSGAEDTFNSEDEDARTFSDRPESISSGEGGIRSLSSEGEKNGLPSLGLSSDSSVWSPSDQNTTDHSVEDKFTSADGEIIYYSDFSIEALTARQYTQRSQRSQRSDILEWSQNLKNATIIPGEFVQKKIQLLKRQSLSDEIEAPSMSPVRSRRTGKDLEKVDSVDLKDFCSKKLHNLKKYHTDSGACKAMSSEATNFYRRLKDDSDVTTYGIPLSVVQRLRIDMKSKIDFHEPSACDRCREKLGELGLSEFLQSKLAITREQLTNLKLNDARNASTYGMKIIGEILSEASCLSCKPELVMQRLLEPLVVHTTSTEAVTKRAEFDTEQFGLWMKIQQR